MACSSKKRICHIVRSSANCWSAFSCIDFPPLDLRSQRLLGGLEGQPPGTRALQDPLFPALPEPEKEGYLGRLASPNTHPRGGVEGPPAPPHPPTIKKKPAQAHPIILQKE